MKKRIFTVLCALIVMPAFGQQYEAEISRFRKEYISDLMAEPRHPVAAGDEKYILFFKTDSTYRVIADVSLTPGSTPFLIPTHSGKQKPFKEYAVLKFSIRDTIYTLHAYQSLDLINGRKNEQDLFIPFKDITSFESTYGGGRYLDLKTADIVGGKIIVDFNKCYNPYCAYGEGFSCPIPPSENFVETVILAGEKMFAKFSNY